MTKPRRVAIFDIDGTIFRSSLLIEVTEELIEQGIFPTKVRNIYMKPYKNWSNRRDTYEKYIDSVVVAFMKNIKGVDYKAFAKVANKVINAKKDRVYRYTRDLVYELKKKGFFLLAISQSPKELVQNFGYKMGFDKVYGRDYEVGKNGKLTGKVLFLDLIEDKANVLKRAVERNNLTLRGSYGVGDSEGDITLLQMVENPICFNPNNKLYQHAKKHGWAVVVERKDNIYKL
ncbi:MAG TPA: HAD-IB family hydrolase [Candidatus Magasanikbacteria bacterium]|nr:HAD-IB family hydrolase [Candidatus Magasanikbacteria bacterium]